MAETGPAERPTPDQPPPAAATPRDPPRVTWIVGTQACERLSFHGMSSILTAYMVGWLLYDARDARANYHAFLMAAASAPLVGGWLADRFLGRTRTILWVSIISLAGYAALVAWPTRDGLLAGLCLVALGAGGVTPFVPTLVGDQVAPGQRALLARRSSWSFGIIGLGAVAARLLVPGLLRAAGPALAFAIPGVLMALSVAAFWLGRGASPRPPPSGPRPDGFARVTWRALRRLGTGRPGDHWLDAARDRHPAEAVEGAKAVFRLMGLLAVVPVFWSLFDQTGSSWTLQARAMGLSMGAWSLDPSQLQAAGPLFLLGLLPLGTWVVFPALARRGRAVTPLQKMSAGLFITVLSFLAAATVQRLVDLGRPPHVLWQLPQYLLLAVGEVLVAVTGLELCATRAPRAMRSTVLSLWVLTVAVGNFLTWLINRLVGLEGAPSFLLFAGLMLAAALAFRVVARRSGPAPAS